MFRPGFCRFLVIVLDELFQVRWIEQAGRTAAGARDQDYGVTGKRHLSVLAAVIYLTGF